MYSTITYCKKIIIKSRSNPVFISVLRIRIYCTMGPYLYNLNTKIMKEKKIVAFGNKIMLLQEFWNLRETSKAILLKIKNTNYNSNLKDFLPDTEHIYMSEKNSNHVTEIDDI